MDKANIDSNKPDDKKSTVFRQVDKIVKTVTVCNKCLRACCWQGEFMCEWAKTAGTIEETIEVLKMMNLEHPDYWKEP